MPTGLISRALFTAAVLVLVAGCVHGQLREGAAAVGRCPDTPGRACLCGRVADLGGAGVSGVRILVYTAREHRTFSREPLVPGSNTGDADRLWDTAGLGKSVRSDADGAFGVTLLPSEAYLVHANGGPAHIGVAGVVVSTDKSVEIQMAPR